MSFAIHVLSAASALVVSLRHASTLHVSASEMPRYLRKSLNLALCYAGFVPERSYPQAIRAGIAAFLCCAYDVATDWREFRQEERRVFTGLLGKYAHGLQQMALDLLERDWRGELRDDGLERGVTSVRFVMGLIGSVSYYEKRVDLHQLGMACQVADDVLDYETDVSMCDTNCLSSPRWKEYIELLVENLPNSELARLFPNGRVLRYVIQRASEKALVLRDQLTLSQRGNGEQAAELDMGV